MKDQAQPMDTIQERWQQMDASNTGLGFIVNPNDSPWVKIGKLLALRLNDDKEWLLGCIRRIARVDNDQQIIGVSLFAGQVTPVQIKLYEKTPNLSYEVNDMALPPKTQLYNALLWKDEAGLETLVMEGAGYARDRRYVIYDKDASRLVQLDAVEDKGDDWLQTTFRVIGS